jgi:hypothetical protein
MSFATITLCVASQWVFIVVSVHFVIDLVRKLLDTPPYVLDNEQMCPWRGMVRSVLPHVTNQPTPWSSPPWEAGQKTCQRFMEPEGSVPYSQKLAEPSSHITKNQFSKHAYSLLCILYKRVGGHSNWRNVHWSEDGPSVECIYRMSD